MLIAPQAAPHAHGESRAFDLLFRRHFEPLTRLVARMVSCRHVAEELVQDVFLRMWNGREDFAVRDPETYLRRAARNRALDWLRREHLHRAWAEEVLREVRATAPETPSAHQASQDDLAEVRCAIAESLDTMPQRRRLVCQLRWQAELGPTNIASRLGLSVKTVEAHLTTGTKELAARLHRLRDEYSADRARPSRTNRSSANRADDRGAA
jgi:RNA polymerase sigma-70 factor (ECF subfamily)